MKKVRLKKKVRYAFIVIVIFLLFFLTFGLYYINISPVSNKEELVTIEVEEGSSFINLAPNLKRYKLIKSMFYYKLYIKINKPSNLQAGTYQLSKNMSVKEIVKELEGGTTTSKDDITLTFKEGINMRRFISLITENTNIKEEDILSTLNDQNYLDQLIKNYWFIDENIKNENIYYSLEGYLFPDTYQFNKNADIKDIFKVMLDHMDTKLKPYRNDIEKSKYTLHEILTLASIVELEAANSDDRSGVAGVFYNRLESGWSLGSDVTTYYAARVDMSERDLYQKELDDYNSYNTRSSKMAGKLPVGPICMASIESIKAAINPTNHDYYYFVADKNKKTYFNKTSSEHVKTVNMLKDQKLWYEY